MFNELIKNLHAFLCLSTALA